MDEAIISGEYTSFKHIKTRKCVTLEIEIPEENFQDVIAKLGMPIGGESKPVAVCLLRNETDNKPPVVAESTPQEKSEGDKLRVRAIMLCKEKDFQRYCGEMFFCDEDEASAKMFLCHYSNIESRSELTFNKEAQDSFKKLDTLYKEWLKPSVDEQYADNLRRE